MDINSNYIAKDGTYLENLYLGQYLDIATIIAILAKHVVRI